MRHFFLLVFCLLLTACESRQEPYRALGNEPGWMLDITEQGFELLTHYGEKKLTAALVKPKITDTGQQYEFMAEGHKVNIQIIHASCQDVMSGKPFPDQVVVHVDDEVFTGCGSPMLKITSQSQPTSPQVATPSLFDTKWIAETMNGQPIGSAGTFHITLTNEGRLAGKSGCNSYSTSYKIEENILKVDPGIISTKMACLPEIMEIENQFLAILKDSHKLHQLDNKLALSTPDGRTLNFRSQTKE